MIVELFSRRVRGFRIVEVIALCILLTLVLALYLNKTFAWRERTEISQVERKIEHEKARVRLLEAEVAHLENPERLERLSRQYLGMEPVDAEHETRPDALTTLAARSQGVEATP